MKIGVVSDTHDNTRNVRDIVDLFNRNRVDHVIHTGDITKASTLEIFRELEAPLSGVFGNNDTELDQLAAVASRLGFDFGKPPLNLELHGRRIVVVHDPRELTDSTTRGSAIALHGHTHMLRIEQRELLTIFNPGECAGHMKGLNAVGLVDLNSLQPSLLKF